jgi:hypothetical protein
VQVVQGSNRDGEFSGYDEGVRFLRDQSPPDLWLLANDRLLAYDDGYLPLLRPATQRLVVEERLLLGRVDRLPVRCTVGGLAVPTYARSNYLMVDDASLQAIGKVTSVDTAGWATRVPEAHRAGLEALAGEDLPGEYLAFMADWLTGSGSGVHGRWYRAGDADSTSWPRLRLKLQAIVNEHLLSGRLRQAGATVMGTRQAQVLAGTRAHSAVRRRQVGLWRDDPTTAWRSQDDRDLQLRLTLTVLREQLHSPPP